MPLPSTNSTAMNTIMGRSPMIDGNNVLQSLIFTYKYTTKTSAYTCKAEESGTIFNTTGATAAVTFTLPAISDGPWHFKFINSVDLSMTVAAGTADTMIGYNDVDLDSIAASTSAEKIGAMVNVYCDGTSLWVSAETSDPRYQSFTLAD